MTKVALNLVRYWLPELRRIWRRWWDPNLRRRHHWFRSDSAETLGWLTSVLSAPEKVRIAPANIAGDGPARQWQTNSLFGWLALNDGRGYLIPLGSRQTGINALQLYNAQNLKARVAKKLLTVGLKGGVAQLLLRKIRVCIRQDVSAEEKGKILLLEHLKEILGYQELIFAISSGRRGPYRKPTIQIMTRDNNIFGYLKMGWNNATNTLIQNETRILQSLSKIALSKVAVPPVFYSGWWNDRFLCLQGISSGHWRNSPQSLTVLHLRALKEFQAIQTFRQPLRESAFWTKLRQRASQVSDSYYRATLEVGMDYLGEQFGGSSLPFHFCHGDFTPWNTRMDETRLYVFDWEYAADAGSPGWDLFHFIIRSLLLVRRWPGSLIYKALQPKEPLRELLRRSLMYMGHTDDVLEALLLLYLLDRLAFHACSNTPNRNMLVQMAILVNLLIGGNRHGW